MKEHNNLNNCVRKMRAPDVSFAAAGFPERYASQTNNSAAATYSSCLPKP